jgi:hypothetical protein
MYATSPAVKQLLKRIQSDTAALTALLGGTGEAEQGKGTLKKQPKKKIIEDGIRKKIYQK